MVKIWVPPDGGYITRAIIFILVVAVMAVIAQRITDIDRRLRGGLLARPDDRRLVAAAGIFCLGEIVVWLLFVVIPVPFFPGTPEQVETIAVVSKAVEAVGVVLAAGLAGSPLSLLRSPRSRVQTSAREPAGTAGKSWPDSYRGLSPDHNGERGSLVR